MAVAKSRNRWYNSKRELMFGSISRKPNIYCSVGGSCTGRVIYGL
nr:MAG TPA: hypothetical protein [Caudoviricetes sp.]